MAVTPMSNMINPQVMGDMISAKIEALLKITPYAKLDTTLQGIPGNTLTVPSWKYVGDAEDVAEGAEVGLTEMHTDTESFTIKKAMKAIGLTQEAINSGYGDPIGQAESQLAKSIAGKVDNDVFAAALKSSTRYAPDTLVQIGYAPVVDIVDKFNEEDITDKVLFIHPNQITKLRKDGDFISADKYNNNVMVSGEIGMICQTRIVPSKKVPLITHIPCASGDTGALKVVKENASSGEILASAINGHVWDATNKIVKDDYTGEETTSLYVAPVANAYYKCPCIKLEASDAQTEFTEDEYPAVTIFLKKDTQTDADWKPRTQTHEIVTSKYYGVALTNEAKVVVADLKK